MSTPDASSVIAALADRITRGLSTTFEGDGTEDRRAILDRYSELKMSRSFSESAHLARSEWVQARLTEFWKEVVMNEDRAPVPDPDLAQAPTLELSTPADVEARRELARLTTQVEADKIVIAEWAYEAFKSKSENNRLIAESRRFYRADGAYEVLGSPEDVVSRRIAAAEEIERLRKENAALQVKADMEAASDEPPAPTPAPAPAPNADPAEPTFPVPGRLYVSCPGCRTQSTRDRERCPVCGGREFIPARLTTRDVERLKSAHAWEDRVFETVISILSGTGDDQAITGDAELSQCPPVLFAFRVRERLRAAEAEVERLTSEAGHLEKSAKALAERVEMKDGEIEQLRAELTRLNAAVVEHHSQTGDDICIEDDTRLYAAFGLPPRDPWVPPESEMLESCRRFIRQRCRAADPASLKPGEMTIRQLEKEIDRLRQMVALWDQDALARGDEFQWLFEINEQLKIEAKAAGQPKGPEVASTRASASTIDSLAIKKLREGVRKTSKGGPIPPEVPQALAELYGQEVVVIVTCDRIGKYRMAKFGPDVSASRPIPSPIDEVVRLESEVQLLIAESESQRAMTGKYKEFHKRQVRKRQRVARRANQLVAEVGRLNAEVLVLRESVVSWRSESWRLRAALTNIANCDNPAVARELARDAIRNAEVPGA